MKPAISATDALNLYQNGRALFIDARSGPNARENYETAHLAGAFWVDLETDLSEKTENPAHGGRHPLPSVAKFARLLGQLGITPRQRVIVYDDKSGAYAAARFWWMLRAVGHTQTQVLDGGYQAALETGFPLGSGIESPNAAEDYPVHDWKLPLADINEVAAAAADPNWVVIDVREEGRYTGQFEPIDLVAGHIPGAINIPFAGNLGENGCFLPSKELREKYADIQPDKTIVHCGSGVTACHTLLALAQAGLEIPKLYVGSWSEWSRNDRPIATGD